MQKKQIYATFVTSDGALRRVPEEAAQEAIASWKKEGLSVFCQIPDSNHDPKSLKISKKIFQKPGASTSSTPSAQIPQTDGANDSESDDEQDDTSPSPSLRRSRRKRIPTARARGMTGSFPGLDNEEPDDQTSTSPPQSSATRQRNTQTGASNPVPTGAYTGGATPNPTSCPAVLGTPIRMSDSGSPARRLTRSATTGTRIGQPNTATPLFAAAPSDGQDTSGARAPASSDTPSAAQTAARRVWSDILATDAATSRTIVEASEEYPKGVDLLKASIFYGPKELGKRFGFDHSNISHAKTRALTNQANVTGIDVATLRRRFDRRSKVNRGQQSYETRSTPASPIEEPVGATSSSAPTATVRDIFGSGAAAFSVAGAQDPTAVSFDTIAPLDRAAYGGLAGHSTDPTVAPSSGLIPVYQRHQRAVGPRLGEDTRQGFHRFRPGHELDPNNLPDWEMPEGSHLLSPRTQALLAAARRTRVRNSDLPARTYGGPSSSKNDEETQTAGDEDAADKDQEKNDS